jgi:hypothetical protein
VLLWNFLICFNLAKEEISEKEQELYRRRETLECDMLSAQEEIKDIEAEISHIKLIEIRTKGEKQ